MTIEIALVFLIVACALYLFASERLSPDITALVILVTVVALPLLFHSQWLVERGVDLRAAFPTVSEGLSGLSNRATVTVLCMFILSAGIQRSGLIHVLGKRLFPLMGGSELRRIAIIALLVGPVSGVINNTAAVAMTIPLVLDMAHRSGVPAARMLMPLSFFGMLGGTLTVIGTSTNILASALLKDVPSVGRELTMFEFSHLGLMVFAVGLLYFATIGRWLLPLKDAAAPEREVADLYAAELEVREDGALLGKTLKQAEFAERTGVEVIKLLRGGQSRRKQAQTTTLEAGDVIVVRASYRQVADLIKSKDVAVLSQMGERRIARSDGILATALLRNRMRFAGRPAGQTDFWERHQARLIGLDTPEVSSKRLADEPLHVGERVLLDISRTALERLRRHPDLVVLGEFEDNFDRRRMWIAGGIVAAVVLSAALTPLPIVITAIVGVIAMAVTGCIGRDDLYSGVAWDVIFLLAGVIPLGIAMAKSGAAAWLGDSLAWLAADWHPILVLIAIYVITTVLTELVSNNAAVVILVPVAVSLAGSLGLAPLPLVFAAMFAASTSFLSPVGYQTNTMIFGTGVYRFSDFVKVGAPLNLLLAITTSIGIWMFWPVD